MDIAREWKKVSREEVHCGRFLITRANDHEGFVWAIFWDTPEDSIYLESARTLKEVREWLKNNWKAIIREVKRNGGNETH